MLFQEILEKRRQLMVQFENYREKKEEEFAMYKERRLALRNGSHLLFPPTLGVILYAFVQFLLFADFFRKVLSGTPPECQTVWIQIRPNILSGLVWVQTVCKGY